MLRLVFTQPPVRVTEKIWKRAWEVGVGVGGKRARGGGWWLVVGGSWGMTWRKELEG